MTAAILGIILSFCLSVMSYRYVEQPVRRSQVLLGKPHYVYALGAGLIAVAALSGVSARHLAPDAVHIGNGIYLSSDAIKSDRPRIYTDQCLVRFDGTVSPPCSYGLEAGSKTVVLLGDSHAANWFAPLNRAAKQEDWRLLVRTKASCRPVDVEQTRADGGRKRPYTECTQWLATTFDEIERIKPDLVVVAGTRHKLDIDAETRVIQRLARAAPTVVVRDIPWLPVDALGCLRSAKQPEDCAWPMAQLLKGRTYPRTPSDAMPSNAQILDLNSALCANDTCSVVQDGQVTRFDAHHLTASFSRRFTDHFRALMREKATGDK